MNLYFDCIRRIINLEKKELASCHVMMHEMFYALENKCEHCMHVYAVK